MNIQKAMRVRAELKSDAVKLNMLINSVPYVVAFEGKKPEDCALAASVLQAESAFLEKFNLFVKERSTNLFRLRIAMQSNLFKSSGS